MLFRSDDSYVRKYFNDREVKDDSGDFLTSMAVGYATDSVVLGTMAGGNLSGALIGEMLNDSAHDHDYSCDHHHSDNENFS